MWFFSNETPIWVGVLAIFCVPIATFGLVAVMAGDHLFAFVMAMPIAAFAIAASLYRRLSKR